MEDNKPKKSLTELHDAHVEQYLELKNAHMKNWRAWGSWFSWGSPVGLGILYALVMISTGVFLWLEHHR